MKLFCPFVISLIFCADRRPEDLNSEQPELKHIEIINDAPLVVSDTDVSTRTIVQMLAPPVPQDVSNIEIQEPLVDAIANSPSEQFMVTNFGLDELLRGKVSKDVFRAFIGLDEVTNEKWISLVISQPTISDLLLLMEESVWSYIFPWHRLHLLQVNFNELFQLGLQAFQQALRNEYPVRAFRILSCLFQIDGNLNLYQNVLSNEFRSILDVCGVLDYSGRIYTDFKVFEIMTGFASLTRLPAHEVRLLRNLAVSRFLWNQFMITQKENNIPVPLNTYRFISGDTFGAEYPCYLPFQISSKLVSSILTVFINKNMALPMTELYSNLGDSIIQNVHFRGISSYPFVRLIISSLKKFAIPSNYLNFKFLPLLNIAVPKLNSHSIDSDIPDLIPMINPDFFSVNCISQMSFVNIKALTKAQLDKYQDTCLIQLDWDHFNEETLVHVLSHSQRLQRIFTEINVLLIPKLPLSVFIHLAHSGIVSLVKISSTLDGLSEKHKVVFSDILAQNSTLFEFYRFVVLEESYLQTDWCKTAVLIKSMFAVSDLPQISGIDWNNPSLPLEYSAFEIERHYKFEELFAGIPRGVWLAFFGFFEIPSQLHSALWKQKETSTFMLLKIALDPVFSQIFPWQKLSLTRAQRQDLIFFLKHLLIRASTEVESYDRIIISGRIAIVFWRLRYTELYLEPIPGKEKMDAAQVNSFIEKKVGPTLEAVSKTLYRQTSSLLVLVKNYAQQNRCPLRRPLPFNYYLCRRGISYLFDIAILIPELPIFPKTASDRDQWKWETTCKPYKFFKFVCIAEDHSDISVIFLKTLFNTINVSELVSWLKRNNVFDRFYKAAREIFSRENTIRIDSNTIPFFEDKSPKIAAPYLSSELVDPHVIPRLGDFFLAVNKFSSITEHCIPHLTRAQISHLRFSELGMLDWRLLNADALQYLVSLEIITSIMCAGVFRWMNFRLIPIDVFEEAVKILPVPKLLPSKNSDWKDVDDSIAEAILRQLATFDKIDPFFMFQECPEEFLVRLFRVMDRSDFLALGENPWTLADITRVKQVYDKCQSPLLLRMLKNIIPLYEEGPCSFLQLEWKPTELDELMKNVSKENLDNFLLQDFEDVDHRYLYRNLYNYLNFVDVDLLTVVLRWILYGMIRFPPFRIEEHYWKHVYISDLPLSNHKYLSRFLLLNIDQMTVDQRNHVFDYLRNDVISLATVLGDSYLEEPLILPPSFWKIEKKNSVIVPVNMLNTFWFHSTPDFFNSPHPLYSAMAVFGSNMTNIDEEDRSIVYSTLCFNTALLLGILCSRSPLKLPPIFWEMLPKENFEDIVNVYRGIRPSNLPVVQNLNNQKILDGSFRKNFVLNISFMTPNQQHIFIPRLEEGWIKEWKV